MIRPLAHTDRWVAADLWVRCFDDTPTYVAHFLDTFREGLVYEVEKQVVAMLFLLPGSFKGKRIDYIYACATHPEHQKKGYMRMLLDAAYTASIQCGSAGVTLVPATEALVGYYQRCGFQLFAKQKRITVEAKCGCSERLQPLLGNMELLGEIRTAAFKAHGVLWPNTHLHFYLTQPTRSQPHCHFLQYGHSKGYCLCEKQGSQWLVKEFAFETQTPTVEELASYLATIHSVSQVDFIVPFDEYPASATKSIAVAMSRGHELPYHPKNAFYLELG